MQSMMSRLLAEPEKVHTQTARAQVNSYNNIRVEENAQVHLGPKYVQNYYAGSGYDEPDAEAKKQRQSVLRWLSTVPHRKHHSNMIKDVLPGSGKWLLLSEIYLDWRTSEVSSTLWLHGIPGCGKSRLVANVVQTILEEHEISETSTRMAFFYCTRDAAEPKRADPCEILRSILRQLLVSGSDDHIESTVTDAYLRRKRDADEDESDIEPLTIAECIPLILQITNLNHIIVVVDALDESNPAQRYQLINALEEIATQSINVVKIFMSSREDGDIVMRMKGVPNVLIRPSENSEDIRLFVEVEIEKAIKDKRLLGGVVNDDLRTQIKTSLCDGAHGMFQWVNLVIQNLCEFQRLQLAEDVPTEISKLPSGLADLYSLALVQIYGKSSKAKLAAVYALQWLLRIHFPLSCMELTAAIAKVTDTQLLPQDILILCSNLVIMDTELDVFRFAHLSVREYLESHPDFSSEVSEPIVALQCLQICVDSIHRQEVVFSKALDELTHFHYACLYWPVHCYTVGTCLPPLLLSCLQNFLGSSKIGQSLFERWLLVISKSPTRFMDSKTTIGLKMSFSPALHPIFLVIAFELENLMPIVTSLPKFEIEALNQFGLTPLALACNVGNIRICKVLIDKGAEVNVKDIVGVRKVRNARMPLNPITATINRGYSDLTRLLLAAGADLNLDASGGSYGSPLVIAVRLGDKELIEELLEAGADANISWELFPPILWAAMKGQAQIVKLLLNHGANPLLRPTKMSGSSLNAALEVAARHGHLDVVKILVEAGVPVDDNSGIWGTALSQAALNGHAGVVEYLLLQHADPDIASDPYGTPFLSAAACQRSEIAKIFLEQGVDVNQQGGNGGNALIIAAARSHLEVFSLLLEHGADPQAEALYYGRTDTTQALIGSCGSLVILQELVRNLSGSNRNQSLNELLMCAMSGRMDKECSLKVEWLLDIGADPDTQVTDGIRPIHLAVKERQLSIVQKLLDTGARIDVNSALYGSPLQALYHKATPRFEITNVDQNWDDTVTDAIKDEIFHLLLSRGADINARGGLYGNALQAASHSGQIQHIKLMIASGAEIAPIGGLFESPLGAAAAMGHSSVVELYLEYGVDVNIACGLYGSALQAAACLGRYPASLLLDPDQDWIPQEICHGSVTGYFNSILHEDALYYQSIFDLLLKSNPDVQMIGGIYGSAAQAAAYSGQSAMLEALLDKGANVHIRSGFYGSCLQAACCGESRAWCYFNKSYPRSEAWESVLFDDDDDDDDDDDKEEVEEEGMKEEEEEEEPYPESDLQIAVVKLLLNENVNVHVRGGFFGTCLQAAVHSDSPELVQLLLEAGACVCEDGTGFYGGCISAAISFGKRTMIEERAEFFKSNAAQILSMLFDYISIEDFLEIASSAIARARNKGNDEGLGLLKTAISVHPRHYNSLNILFPELSEANET